MTFLTDVLKKGYTEEEILAVLVESEKDRKRRRMLAIVTKTVYSHCLQKMRDLLTFEKLATWRRMNGFDRVASGEENWVHGPRSLPSTPEEYTASLRSDLQELKDAIWMPRQKVSNLINAVEQGKVSYEEFATLKRLVEKQSREAAQAQVTVTPVDTVQYCSPSPQTPEPSPDVCFELENNEGNMDPELKELDHHRLVRVLKRPDSSVPRTRGHGRKDEPSLTAIRSLAWDRTQGETFFHPRRKAWTREPSELRQTSLSCSRATSPKTRIKAAKRTSSLTPVEKERRRRFGTRL